MIADIKVSFVSSVLSRKIDYQLKKIDKGVARELYNSSGGELSSMKDNMMLIASLNNRVKMPFTEIIISLPTGERLSDEKFTELTNEYIEKMGYSNSCYSVILNEDKENQHVHILATKVDTFGKKIGDNFEKVRSSRISRELEEKYNLEKIEKKGFAKMTLGEAQQRKYYFDTTLHKALKSYNTKTIINDLLKKSEYYNSIDKTKSYTNVEWQIILGDDLYGKVGNILSERNFFKSLLKDELISAMDKVYVNSSNVSEFRRELEVNGYYMRLVSDKGNSHYVYGIKDSNFYVKDTSLPQKYRYGNIKFVYNKTLSFDEQKHYLYNAIFGALKHTSSYKEFKFYLQNNNISINEHSNSRGMYGLSFSINGLDNSISFKATEISAKLSYKNIQEYYSNKDTSTSTEIENVIDRVEEQELMRDNNIMMPVISNVIDSGNRSRYKEDDDEQMKRRKKRKGNQMSR